MDESRREEIERLLEEACAKAPSLRQEIASLLRPLTGNETQWDASIVRELLAAFTDAASAPPAAGSADLPASLDLAEFTPGAKVGDRYRIVSLLGRGGMGEVYRADDLTLGQPVALKFLPRRLSEDSTSISRLMREARIGRQVSHPNVASIYDIGDVDGRYYLSMEYIAGEDLRSLLRRVGRLSREKALEIAHQLCAGLAAAHARGVLHRDLKPANVMIDAHGRARITDFGLAVALHRTKSAEIAGTPAYMAPEQLVGGRLSIQSDLYALGLILYELFAGAQLLPAATLGERWQMAREGRAPSVSNRDVDPVVARIVSRCLAPQPEARPASALAVAAALPGGDPLAAALAAGVIPSAEAVAAARDRSVVRPAAAFALLAAAIAGLIAVTSQSDRILLPHRSQLTHSPDALADRARTILETFDAGVTDGASAQWYALAANYRDLVEQRDAPIERLQWFAPEPPPLVFVYRRSPYAFTPLNLFGVTSYRDPAADVPGMADVSLDADGRLVRFTAVPLTSASSGSRPDDVDWSRGFAHAGLDIAAFERIETSWTPPFTADRRDTWRAREATIAPAIVMAASWQGRPVYFEVDRSGGAVAAPDVRAGETRPTAETMLFLLTTVALMGAVLLAWRNIRLDRWDRAGTLRLAGYYFVTVALCVILRADHVTGLRDEYMLMVRLLGFALYSAAFLSVVYVALEPFVRRQWPDILTTWARLLAGRLRDPLVARDILVGAVAGIAMPGIREMAQALSPWLPWLAATPFNWTLEGLRSPRHLAALVLYIHEQAIGFSLGVLFLMLAARILLRKPWLTQVALTVMIAPVLVRPGQSGAAQLAIALLLAALAVTVLCRCGLVAMISALFFAFLLERVPFAFESAQFYFSRSLVTLAILAGLLLAAFRAALGGRPLLGVRLLDE